MLPSRFFLIPTERQHTNWNLGRTLVSLPGTSKEICKTLLAPNNEKHDLPEKSKSKSWIHICLFKQPEKKPIQLSRCCMQLPVCSTVRSLLSPLSGRTHENTKRTVSLAPSQSVARAAFRKIRLARHSKR